jgi:predicted nucleic acid-binding protein
MLQDGNLQVVTSELALAECLVCPSNRKPRRPASARNGAFQWRQAHRGADLPRNLIEAARLRALHGLEMPDAIHGATAKIARCKWFLTNDAFWPVLRVLKHFA